MAIELITGRSGKAHVDSSDVRAFNAYVNASGRYVLHGGGATIESANDLRILPAEIMMDGAHVRITGTGEEVTLENGASSYDRIDIVALHYTSVGSDDSRVESVTLEVIKGTPVDTGGGAQDPAMPVPGTSILNGSSEVYVPYVRVKITGLVPGDPEELLPGRAQMVNDMITGSNSGVDALSSLGIKEWLLDNVFKVGYVWISYTDTSPSGLVGGTWTPITGRFPYFNAGSGTGGANSLALSTEQMPRHIHTTESMRNAGYWLGYNSYGDTSSAAGVAYSTITNQYAIKVSNKISTENLNEYRGSGSSFDNMPAYQTLYAWRRTA